MISTDHMKYKDVVYGNDKYRGVVFDAYRPISTNLEFDTPFDEWIYQDDNGYERNTVYWFKYEPIVWQVLDPATGMVMAKTILDSQTFNSYILKSGYDEYDENAYWSDPEGMYYANNYAYSEIREWLNTDFFNTAFSTVQQDIISFTTIDTPAYKENCSAFDSPSTTEKVYLPSCDEVLNTAYGFSESSNKDANKITTGSDYAKCQGLYVSKSEGYVGNSDWKLRTAGYKSLYICYATSFGTIYYSGDAHDTHTGIRPVININPSSEIVQTDVSKTGEGTGSGLPEASVRIGDKTTYYVAIDEAFAAADGKTATITLISDCSTENIIEINSGDITLDTASYTLKTDSSYMGGGKLTIKGNGTIKADTEEKTYINVTDGAELVMESGTFDGKIEAYTNSSANAEAVVTINGGTVYQLQIDGSSDTYDAKVTVNGGTISGPQINIFYNGKLVLNKCSFTANSVSIWGGDATLADILGEGKAYYDANGEIVVLTEGQTEINHPFTVGDIDYSAIKKAVDALDVKTVTSTDATALSAFKADLAKIKASANPTDEQAKEIDALGEKIDTLIAKLDEVREELDKIDATVRAYDLNSVKSSDTDDINKLKDDIKALTDTQNLSESERELMANDAAILNELLAKIDTTATDIAEIIGTLYDYAKETVKTPYREYIKELIDRADAYKNGGNTTETEKANLSAAITYGNELIDVIDNVEAELERIDGEADKYAIDSVKSTERQAIEALKADIKALTDTQNLIELEREALIETDTFLAGLLERIDATAEEIARLTAETAKYDEATVTSNDLDALNQLKEDIAALALTDNVTADEKANLEALNEKVNGLITKLTGIGEEITRLVEAVDAYVFESVKSSDKADIEKLIEDIKALTDTDNLTDDERAVLSTTDSIADDLLEKIAAVAAEINRVEDATESYDVESVKSIDKAGLEELLAASEELQNGDNITEEEKASLAETDKAIADLLNKIAATEEEINRINEAINTYDEETVKSSDKAAIDQLIEDIKALTDGENITEEEKAALEALDEAADALNEKIDEVAAEKKRVEDAVAAYNEETVKSSDKEAIEQLKDDIQALIDSGNITEEEADALNGAIDAADTLTDRIAETEKAMADVAAGADAFDSATVTSDDKQAVNDLIAGIDEIIASGNATEEEIAKLNETKAELNSLIEKFNEATAKVDAIQLPDKNRVTKFSEDELGALLAQIEELLTDTNMGTAEKAKLNDYKAQVEEMLEIINSPKEYFSLRFFYFILDCFSWKYNGILWLFSKIFGVSC